MREDLPCKVACKAKLNAESAKAFKEKIDDEYRVNMILDNLPVVVLRLRRDGSQATTYEHGFRVGFKGNYQGVWIRTQKSIAIVEVLFTHAISTCYCFCRAQRRNILSITTLASGS
ncbi:hypothetical protein Q3G72_013048 [Acer saccharum]|nr:hypothetical protein Q3G72_013048 [Acer saccharum]